MDCVRTYCALVFSQGNLDPRECLRESNPPQPRVTICVWCGVAAHSGDSITVNSTRSVAVHLYSQYPPRTCCCDRFLHSTLFSTRTTYGADTLYGGQRGVRITN